MKPSTHGKAKPTWLLSALFSCLLMAAGSASALNLCLDKNTGKKVMTEAPCGENKQLNSTGDVTTKVDTTTPPWKTQARKDRCKILVQKANSPIKARAFADLCTKPLDEAQFNECVAQVNYSNSPDKLAASVATCTGDGSATERLAPAPITIQRGYER